MLHVQAFVDVDTTAGLEGMAAVLAAREEYRDLVDLQVVAFPQDGLLRDPGAAELCEEALRLGADVVGGIPWIEHTDRDAAEHVAWACRLAAANGARVAMLTDDAGDPALRTTAMLAEAMIEHGLHGRGVACHARALATYPTPSVVRLADLARAAGLGFVSDPHTGPLHLPVREFLADDLPVALARTTSRTPTTRSAGTTCSRSRSWPRTCWASSSGPDQLRLLDIVTERAARGARHPRPRDRGRQPGRPLRPPPRAGRRRAARARAAAVGAARQAASSPSRRSARRSTARRLRCPGRHTFWSPCDHFV